MIDRKKQIVSAVQEAGVVGAGGAGFPTYVKLNASVKTVIANGSECEPLLETDKTLMKESPHLVVEGMKIAMEATGAVEGIIAVKGHYKDVVASLEKAIEGEKGITLHLLENYYPAGDEFLTVYDVTGKVIPEGGIPLDVGVVVNNVLTLAQIYQAVNGKTVTERLLTITGEVENPQVLNVPVGTTYKEIVDIAGGFTTDKPYIIDGGPMMGQIIDDWDKGIGKTTSGIIVLPEDHFLITMQKKSISQMVKLSKAACCQCFRCSDLCPRNLIGHDLYPHATMRTIDYNIDEPTEHITSAFLCSQCGVCELLSCDFMLLSPRMIYAEYRKLLVKKGIKNPHHRGNLKVRSQYEHRKIKIPTVIKKLGLTKYVNKLPYSGDKEIKRVKIALNKHIGAPAQPIVVIGELVKLGQKIAESPITGLGSKYHASIEGVVVDVDNDYIEIIKK